MARAMATVAETFRDIVFVVRQPNGMDDVGHAIAQCAKEIVIPKLKPESIATRDISNGDPRNVRTRRPNIHANGPNGYPGKNVRCFHIWTPRRYITKRAGVVMRAGKKGG